MLIASISTHRRYLQNDIAMLHPADVLSDAKQRRARVANRDRETVSKFNCKSANRHKAVMLVSSQYSLSRDATFHHNHAMNQGKDAAARYIGEVPHGRGILFAILF